MVEEIAAYSLKLQDFRGKLIFKLVQYFQYTFNFTDSAKSISKLSLLLIYSH